MRPTLLMIRSASSTEGGRSISPRFFGRYGSIRMRQNATSPSSFNSSSVIGCRRWASFTWSSARRIAVLGPLLTFFCLQGVRDFVEVRLHHFVDCCYLELTLR